MSQRRDNEITEVEQALARMPRDIDPPRDLWPAIESRIGERAGRLDELAERLPERIEVPEDLWPGIAARIDGRSDMGAAYGGPGFGGFSIAAGIACVLLIGGLFAYSARLGGPDAGAGIAAEIEPWFLEPEQLVLLSPAAAAAVEDARPTIERDIRLVRDERRAIEVAIRAEPGNHDLRALWRHAYETELSLLAEVERVMSDFQRG